MALLKTYNVRSQSDKKTIYKVEIDSQGNHACNCIHFEMKCFRAGTYCKHIKFILNKYYKNGK